MKTFGQSSDGAADAQLAIASEQLLFGSAPPPEGAAAGKVLLVKRLQSRAAPKHELLPLHALETEHDWACYLQERIAVEAQYGVAPEAAHKMVEEMRRRQCSQPIAWYFLLDQNTAVGAIGLLVFEHAGIRCGRLQDVDVFPRFRGKAYGHQSLAAIETLAFEQGLECLVVGADQDDWPLQWYLRSSYQQVAVVAKVRPTR